MKKLTIGVAIVAVTMALTLGLSTNNVVAADEIKWGVLIDLSGPTSDWGKNQLKGQLDAMRWVNEHGGINGKDLNGFGITGRTKAATPRSATCIRTTSTAGIS